jgi:ribosomal protein L16 Arg81 hydroxylase
MPDYQYSVDRRSNLSAEEFFTQYHRANRPVIITDGMTHWPAMLLWSPAYLRQMCGDVTVQVMSGREADSNYEIGCEAHKESIRFSEYIDRIAQSGESNDNYLVANNNFMSTEAGKRLFADIGGMPNFLDNRRDGFVFLWFGPAGTVTPLHHDTTDIFLCQVYGRKRVTMIPAGHRPYVYNKIGVFGEVDCENPDVRRHPLYHQASKTIFDLNPGEALFIPVGWWHHVRALDVSINVSFINFWGSFGAGY